MLDPVLQKNDKKARILILVFSAIVFAAVVALGRTKLDVYLGFDVHIFAFINSVINSFVAILLLLALIAVKSKRYLLHKKLMMTAMVLSILFLVSYICHHLFAGETKFGGEGFQKTLYYILLGTHIPFAGLILPFILFTAYRALIAEWPQHKKLARITWPIWLYVAITGVIVYWMIQPYYNQS
jgi:putative membrane protein